MKALVVIDNLYTGGIASSFLNFLKYFVDYTECDILVFNGVIPDKTLIPSKVKILPTNKRLLLLGCSQKEIGKNHKFLSILRVILVCIGRLTSGVVARKILFSSYTIPHKYDIAISFTHDDKWNTFSRGCNQFVLTCVDAKEKVSFVHCDFLKFEGFNLKYGEIYNKFNHIVCVSNSCRKSFISCFPNLNNKCVVVENFINEERIVKLSKNPIIYNSNVVNILSVCRISEEKGLFRAAKCFRKLKMNGIINFHWTVVGGGSLLENFRSILYKYGLTEFVTLVGEQNNPYPYFVNANLFLLPSYHEAAPMVFGECNVLGIPILSTETISARELVEDRSVGVVCENSEDGIYNSLKLIIENNGKIKDYQRINNVNQFSKTSLELFLKLL